MVPLDEAPPELTKRYNAIMRGDEKLDTVPKLRAFWLFAIEQGWPHPEMREYIQGMMVAVADRYYDDFLRNASGGLKLAYLDLADSAAIYKDSSTLEITEIEKQLYDNAWLFLQHMIEDEDGDIDSAAFKKV